MANSGIYKIANKSNGKVYIGQSNCVPNRISSHFLMLRRGRHHSRGMQVDWDNGDIFEWVIIESIPVSQLTERERYWINHYSSNSTEKGYNSRLPAVWEEDAGSSQARQQANQIVDKADPQYSIDNWVDTLMNGEEAGEITREVVYNTLLSLTCEVAEVAYHKTISDLNDSQFKSSQEVADLYGVSRQSINARANRFKKRLGSFGWQVGQGAWVFTPEEVELLRPGPSGRPKKGK